MSLLKAAMTDCVMLDKVTGTPDSYGAVRKNYVDGARFKAAIWFDNSMQARTAEAQGVKNLYTVSTPKSIVLEYHDVFRREEDGKIFRVTSDGDDKATPSSATLDMRIVGAEEWVIPKNE